MSDYDLTGSLLRRTKLTHEWKGRSRLLLYSPLELSSVCFLVFLPNACQECLP